jgi:hypothetical protein
MPLPNRRKDETKKEYIGRCISSISDEYERSQSIAICISKSEEKMSESDFGEEIFVLKPKKNENRGTYLTRCSNNSKMKSNISNMKDRMNFCLNSFNEYYKYWSRLEEFSTPEESTLAECIAHEKSKGNDYRTSYAACSTKVVAPNTTINLNDDNLLVEPVE